MADSPPQNLPVENHKLAWIALSLAIAGLVFPMLLALVCELISDKNVSTFCMALFAAIELSALGCGIVARRAPAAKAALIISVLSLIVVALTFPSRSSQSQSPPPVPTEVADLPQPSKPKNLTR